MFEKALAIDPKNTMALSGLALALGISVTYGWTDDRESAQEIGLASAQQAVELDDKDAEAHFALARYNFAINELDVAIAECRRALEINPNLAVAEGFLGAALSWRGDYGGAILHAERAARLSPNDPAYSWSSHARASAAFGAAKYEQAVEWAKKTIDATPESPVGWRYLTASLAHLGRIDEARAAKDRLLRILPHESAGLVRANMPSDNADFIDRFVDGLRKAGVPE
jgi:tetratricopeptide (TPR) repeat protein